MWYESLKYFSPSKDPKINWAECDKEAMSMLDMARHSAGIPFIITSHKRSISHDLQLAGFAGAHTEQPCSAFDILARNDTERFLITKALLGVGFKRIGINAKNGHIHVDNSKRLPNQVLWIE
jgi:hypothetical protein